MRPDQHPCPECGDPVDDFYPKRRRPRVYCSLHCSSTNGSRKAHAAKGNLIRCYWCDQFYLPSAELEPGMCSLRCAHGKRRRVAA